MAALCLRFVTLLTRVPEAYELVRKHRSHRPGFLILAPNGEKRGSIAISSGKDAGKVNAYLERARASPQALEDQHPAPLSLPLDRLSGMFAVAETAPVLEKAGLQFGARLVRVNGRLLSERGDLSAALESNPPGEEEFYEFEQAGKRIDVRTSAPLPGIRYVLVLERPARPKSENP